MNPDALERLITRAEALLARVEATLPAPAPATDWSAHAYRWHGSGQNGWIEGLPQLEAIRLEDLQDIDSQKARVDANTRQFVAGRRANNVLLTGARGTGKSSLVRALLNRYGEAGLRVLEIDRGDLRDLPVIVRQLSARPERFILFCDDLSFEDHDPAYKALKSVLDGSFAAVPANILVYATSNRRHLMPEYFAENLDTRHGEGELHPGEAVEEKVSLSERFGLWVSFYSFSQDEYLRIVQHWLREFGVELATWDADIRAEALLWSQMRASRTGRVAWQFARDYAGRLEAQ